MVSANREMVVYCFDTLLAHYNGEEAPPPAFHGGQQYFLLSLSLSLYLFIYVRSAIVMWEFSCIFGFFRMIEFVGLVILRLLGGF